MNKELYIGVMSGTSLDGIDISLCEIDVKSCTPIYMKEYPFPSSIKENILSLINTTTDLLSIGTLNTELGYLYAQAINDFLKIYSLDSSKITAIGLHGQTLWHQPEQEYPFSMQLGCPNVVYTQTNIKVVHDFRSMDIANGGQGAPLTPAFHQFIFQNQEKKTAVLNIGGMANITLLGNSLKGWDTGVGNALLDYWVYKCKELAFDEDGTFARCGMIHKKLLQSFMNDSYINLSSPKSTGREYYNPDWLAVHLVKFSKIANEDIQRTLLEFTAQSITNDIKNTDIESVIVCGGGAKNIFLMHRLQDLNSCDILYDNNLSINGDFLESMAFAWFAYKKIHNEVIDIKSVTGARKNSVLGGIYG